MNLKVLPLAITMMVGPGIMADVVLITAPRPVNVPVAFVAGVTIATTAGVLVAIGVVGLLVVASVRNYVQRETIEPPRWMGVLQNAAPRRAFMTGLLLVWVMPSDLVIMLMVGVNLAHNGASLLRPCRSSWLPSSSPHSPCLHTCCFTGAHSGLPQRCGTG